MTQGPEVRSNVNLRKRSTWLPSALVRGQKWGRSNIRRQAEMLTEMVTIKELMDPGQVKNSQTVNVRLEQPAQSYCLWPMNQTHLIAITWQFVWIREIGSKLRPLIEVARVTDMTFDRTTPLSVQMMRQTVRLQCHPQVYRPWCCERRQHIKPHKNQWYSHKARWILYEIWSRSLSKNRF